MVAPSLCSPIILELLFLSHNKIVIDHKAHTVIAKDSEFDLLNPKVPNAPPPPKKKLKEFFHDLQVDRKLMLAKLRMVCTECPCQWKNHLEKFKPVDKVAAIRRHIETLNLQDQLDHLGKAVKDKYKGLWITTIQLFQNVCCL